MVPMNEVGLIKLKNILQDLIHKEIKSESKDKSITFYIGLIESAFSQESPFHRVILDDAKTLIKNIENETSKLNDSTAIAALLAIRLSGRDNQKVKEKINAYLKSRLSDFEYSPLKNAMMLFLLCQGVDYLEPSLKDVISNKLTDLMDTSHTLENACLIYASYLVLNKNAAKSIREKLAEKVIKYEPNEMTLSQGIYALWFYEIFIALYINSFDQVLKPLIERWNKELKKQIIPKLLKELSLKPMETDIDENLINEPLSVSTFELSLVYETILKNEDKFMIIFQQDFTNSLIEKSQGIFLGKIKWQSCFWIFLSLALFTLPWYLLIGSNPVILITAMIGLSAVILILGLRYKHIKLFLMERREWITNNYRSLLSGLLLGILVAYIVSILVKAFGIPAWTVPGGGVGGLIISILITPLKNILNSLLFSIKIPDELKESEEQ